MNEEQKRIKAIIDEQIRLLAENPKLKGKTDAQLWTAEQRSRAMKSRMNDPEFKEKWKEQYKLSRETLNNNPEWKHTHKLAMEKRAHNPSWQENQKLAVQKANNKQISCDSVIFESGTAAALALAPKTRLTEKSKRKWISAQMKKYPERYFYIDTDSI